jgi:Mannosylglycerate hydrolase MGH1-like glycoside hydrolase domain/Glycosyl hydrolase family 63 C-terminal domain
MTIDSTDEAQRLQQANAGEKAWRRWGPYVSERQWGTVREDYSANGDAWAFFPHDHARSRAYRWGEDGLGGFCDDKQLLCLGLALWNGSDPMLKERMFGLTNSQGNHGEDVKEIYYYLDAVPSYSYARMLYKYPQAAYPYDWLVEENARRNKQQPEFEIIDTGIFADNRYFDIDIEYAKADVDDILMRVTASNRGPEAATIHLLPQVWFRNTWSWVNDARKPWLRANGPDTVIFEHDTLGNFAILFEEPNTLLFCDNETNVAKVFGVQESEGPFKDAFDAFVVHGDTSAVNPENVGTKTAGLYVRDVPPGGQTVVRLRLAPSSSSTNAFSDFDGVFARRISEADTYYAALQRSIPDPDVRRVQRQALAGMLWSKQYYHYDVTQWLEGDPTQPKPPQVRKQERNSDWIHLNTAAIIAMPDKWEYPWFAAWDLAFHLVTLALVDPRSAKDQLVLLCQPWYMHPNGQLPAYEWNFGDVNPPVHAWAALRIYDLEKRQNGGKGDRSFLKRVFVKLLLNFTWWVNRKDPKGRNVFQGGFLGLDNIGCFDRSAPLPIGGTLTQSDGTSWMGMFSLNMMRIALELAQDDDAFEDIATKFFEHFLLIGGAMTNIGGEGLGLWDDRDNFYYDWLMLSSGERMPLRLRSMVGLIPLFAVEVLDDDLLQRLPQFTERMLWYLQHRPKLASLVSRWQQPGIDKRRLLAIARAYRMKRVLARMLDENEFLSPYGVRALSRAHLDTPFVFEIDGFRSEERYVPGDSDSGMFGGNSNWRGPIWMPVNYLIIESLRKFDAFYGAEFRVECPTGSGNMLCLGEVADDLCNRLSRIFLSDRDGRRPVFNGYEQLQTDPHFKDYVWFHEYFHGDNGRGVGASHQTGWTGLIANLVDDLYSSDR